MSDYFGNNKEKGPSLDALHQADRVPLQPKPVITPKKPAVMEMPPQIGPEQLQLLDGVEEIRHEVEVTVDTYQEELKDEILDLIYECSYRQAYSLSHELGIDVTNHPRLFDILENEIRQVMIEGKKPTEQYFKLFYLLGGNMNLDAVPGLKDFILMVFDHYHKKCWPKSGSKPLQRLIRLFGNQIDFGDVRDFV